MYDGKRMKKTILILLLSSLLLSGCKIGDPSSISLTDVVSTPLPQNQDSAAPAYQDPRSLIGFWQDSQDGEKNVSVQIKPSTDAATNQTSYFLNASAVGWEDPQKGAYYQGWLIGESGNTLTKTTLLEKIDDKHLDVSDLGKELKAFRFYLISRETNDNSTTPTQELVRVELFDPGLTTEY